MSSILRQINTDLLEEKTLADLNQQFLKTKPFPHIVIKNFLTEKVASKLRAALEKETFIEKESDLFSFKQTSDLYFSKVPEIKKFNTECLNWEFFSLIEKITKTKLSGTLDMSATLYESCDFLLPHDDEVEGRKIAYLLYLSKDFEEEDGGSFMLYNSDKNTPTTVAKKVPPEFNSLLLFEVSKNSFHEVLENVSNKKRYTIGGWVK